MTLRYLDEDRFNLCSVFPPFLEFLNSGRMFSDYTIIYNRNDTSLSETYNVPRSSFFVRSPRDISDSRTAADEVARASANAFLGHLIARIASRILRIQSASHACVSSSYVFSHQRRRRKGEKEKARREEEGEEGGKEGGKEGKTEGAEKRGQ